MKRIILLFFISLTAEVAVAQDSTLVTKKNFYVMFGASIPLSKNQHVIGNASVVVEPNEKFLLALRYYGHEFLHAVPKDDHVSEKYVPWHALNEVNISVGKVKHVDEKVTISFSTGPSFVEYQMPYNIKKVSHPNNSWGGFFNSSIYEYDGRKYQLLGWSVRSDIAFIRKQRYGLSLGAFLNYNRKLPTGGLNVNLVLGRILAREEGK